MPGLINSQMSSNEQEAMPAEAEQMPPQAGQMPPEKMNDMGPEPDPESDPNYNQAVQFAMEVMYGQKAAKQIAQSLKISRDKVEGMANTAYDIVSIVDERTDGAIPDELIAAFATFVLEEVAEIADAAGLDVQPSDVALALKQMILRFLGEQGVDTTQLQQAMDQVDPEEFNRIEQEGGEMEEEVPA